MKIKVRDMIIENPLLRYAEEKEEVKNILEYEKAFELPQKIDKIEDGCIICGSHLKGNKNMGYYCDNCNVLFSENNLLNADKIIFL